MSPRLKSLFARCPELKISEDDIAEIFAALARSIRQGGKLLICGNGGSAADAEHWTGELLKGFLQKRQLSQREKDSLPESLAHKLQGSIPAIPLGSFNSLSSAFANDVDPHLIYAQLVWGLGRPGDVLIGLSTSGNANNVCLAMEAAKAKSITRVGLTGQGGGKLPGLTDLCLCVPSTETYRIQELHLPVYHCLSMMLEDEFFPEK